MAQNSKYNQRRWARPKDRAANYAHKRKAKVHNRGPKEGQPLTDYEAGLRSDYLQCQADHSGLYKYKQAMDAGKTKKEAREYSNSKGIKLADFFKKK